MVILGGVGVSAERGTPVCAVVGVGGGLRGKRGGSKSRDSFLDAEFPRNHTAEYDPFSKSQLASRN